MIFTTLRPKHRLLRIFVLHAFMIKFADLIFSFGDNSNIRFTVMIIQCREEVGITNYKHSINALMIILCSINSIMAIGSP